MTSRRLAGLAAALVLLLARAAPAHEFQPCVLDLRELPGGRYEVTWKAPAASAEGAGAPAPEPVFPPHCHREGEELAAVRWILACGPEGLSGHPVRIAGLSLGKTDALLRFTGEGGAALTAVLRADSPSIVLPRSGAGPRARVAATYFGAGVEHLLAGWDHLLFVLGLLLLVRRPRALIGTITAFTAAHSVSLALAVTGVLRVPAAPAEAAIALSLLLLARELVRPDAPTLVGAVGGSALRTPRTSIRLPELRSGSVTRPWVMAFAFGLVHGLGFAGGLRALGLPPGQIPLALIAFNLGLEAAQVALVAAALLLARLLPRERLRASRLPAYLIGSLASFWLLQRVASFWTAG